MQSMFLYKNFLAEICQNLIPGERFSLMVYMYVYILGGSVVDAVGENVSVIGGGVVVGGAVVVGGGVVVGREVVAPSQSQG